MEQINFSKPFSVLSDSEIDHIEAVDDLALALAAKDIRIEAPIPGKSAIGIEVPNQEVAIVTLREVLDSDRSKEDTNVLSVALGRDISGEPVLAPLNKMPHLLVAGATGSGKSVCGADVVYGQAKVHASGHGSQEELKSSITCRMGRYFYRCRRSYDG